MRFQVGITVAFLAVLLFGLPPGSAEAGGRLPALSYGGGGQGKVMFNHQAHASKGLHCNDCHIDFSGTGKQLFTTRKQGLISLADHKNGAKCSACHNGKGAFDDCNRCHY